jgi:hypothetical protein
MRRDLFLRIVRDVQLVDEDFVQKRDASGKLGLSARQKVIAALRQLAYGSSGDAVDEYLRMGESTARKCMKRFCSAVIKAYKDEYLRRPNEEDIKRLQEVGRDRGFPGMLGSLDCMHWTWKSCPTAWHGQYVGKEKKPTMVLEAVASYDLWIWHYFFGLPGSLNDINILDRSPLFAEVAEGTGPSTSFEVNNRSYSMGYYLVDGIYPSYSTFVQTVSALQSHKHKVYKKISRILDS